jgi:hypothetical protein
MSASTSASTNDSTFTFENGRTVTITRVSPLTLQSVERSCPRPIPPIQKTDLGAEPNYAHPDYIAALNEWQRKINEMSLDTVILFGVETNIDMPALEKARAKAKRAGITLPDDDLLCYVKHICIGSLDELARLRVKILDTSLPTEERIGEAAEGFKSDVEGDAHSEGARAA